MLSMLILLGGESFIHIIKIGYKDKYLKIKWLLVCHPSPFRKYCWLKVSNYIPLKKAFWYLLLKNNSNSKTTRKSNAWAPDFSGVVHS